ncbi:epoxide hydrolase N-terminal domain-containing protein [Micromonospora sp. DT43]|uniref:epoxide hydrolase N-terminal domain-containing protein n=1 Tax=Micromonospora sp. DT43 TaxID=3393440 RepID=UPI003CF055D2
MEIHFIALRSQHEDALPLTVTHGWPGWSSNCSRGRRAHRPQPRTMVLSRTRCTVATWAPPARTRRAAKVRCSVLTATCSAVLSALDQLPATCAQERDARRAEPGHD